MGTYSQLLKEARTDYFHAEHMLSVTYPLIQDTKLLIGITENLFLALTKIISILVYYEHDLKRINLAQDDFENKLNLFRSHCVNYYHLSPSILNMIIDLREILTQHQTCPIEFRRKDKFIICTNTYKVQEITPFQLTEYLKKTKDFLDLTENTITKNE